MSKRKKNTLYQRMQKAKATWCKGKKGATKATVKAAAKKYVDDAVKKGKSKSEAQKSANRVLNGGCKMTSRITGKKKKKTTRRKRK